MGAVALAACSTASPLGEVTPLSWPPELVALDPRRAAVGAAAFLLGLAGGLEFAAEKTDAAESIDGLQGTAQVAQVLL